MWNLICVWYGNCIDQLKKKENSLLLRYWNSWIIQLSQNHLKDVDFEPLTPMLEITSSRYILGTQFNTRKLRHHLLLLLLLYCWSFRVISSATSSKELRFCQYFFLSILYISLALLNYTKDFLYLKCQWKKRKMFSRLNTVKS